MAIVMKSLKTTTAAEIGGVPAWMRKGNKAAEFIEQVSKEVAERQERFNNRAFRFWLNEGEEARVTFVDGHLTDKGVLDIVTFMEHNLFENGKWGNEYVCTAEVEPCPLCEEGNKPTLVGALTVIDHRKITGKNGKVYENERKLYVAKRETIRILQSLAGKRGGLAGCVFDIMRTGDKTPRVGSQFDFQAKLDVSELRQKYMRQVNGKQETYFIPVDYVNDIEYLSAEDLRKRGYGSGKIIGSEQKTNLKAQL